MANGFMFGVRTSSMFGNVRASVGQHRGMGQSGDSFRCHRRNAQNIVMAFERAPSPSPRGSESRFLFLPKKQRPEIEATLVAELQHAPAIPVWSMRDDATIT